MMQRFTLPEVAPGSVLGVNYSGMHDSAIAIVGPDGAPVFAASLERLSRVKQDGRPPFALLEQVPWDRIRTVAVSAPEHFAAPADTVSVLHPRPLPAPRKEPLRHAPDFGEFFDALPAAKLFVGHQESHAASAFWASGFDEALCLTYDGGMSNDAWFGGLFRATRGGLAALDRFSAMHYAKATSLYTFVTALLGFTPNKHEGKVTGLAAYGKASARCAALFEEWLGPDYLAMEGTLRWVFPYSRDAVPKFIADPAALEPFRARIAGIPREEVAATVQDFAERHVLEILSRARERSWTSANICLAGGLFANVRINQRVVESGFERLFVAPPMTDDGTALGAAWHALALAGRLAPRALHSMYWGPAYDAARNREAVSAEQVNVRETADAAGEIASLLAGGAVVAVFRGACEFGPRALGNRSILAPATDPDINRALNERLDRTEFMPFAPMSRAEDAGMLYRGIEAVRHAAEFMTVTVDCTDELKRMCPAVVHVDGTARPQLVTREANPFIHDVLTRYREATGRAAIVNTSFNIHEEPIVCSPEDALRGFFESGIDYLYLEGVGLVPIEGNDAATVRFLRRKARGAKRGATEDVSALLARERADALRGQEEKERVIATLHEEVGRARERADLVEEAARAQQASNDARVDELRRDIRKLDAQLMEKEGVIRKLDEAVAAYRLTFAAFGSLIRAFNPLYSRVSGSLRRGWRSVTPRLGVLYQHPPIPMQLPQHYAKQVEVSGSTPRISIVTPSFRQAAFIERTIVSVLDQGYPNLEYVVQDGGSEDGTREILERYSDRLASWELRRDSGQTQAINRGFARTTGDIMAWLNSDDILLPGALHYVAEFFNRHPEVDVVYGHRICIDENDQQIGRWVMPRHNDEVLSWADFVPQETLFFRRALWEKAGGRVDETFRFAMDWDLLVRFRDVGGRFARLPRFIGGFRIHPQQKTSAVIGEVGFQEMNRIRERVLGRVPDSIEVRKAVLPYLLKHVATDLRWAIGNKLGMGT